MQVVGVAPAVEAVWWVRIVDDVNVYPAAADAQRSFQRLEHATALCAAGSEAVLHDFECDGLGFALAALLAARRLACRGHAEDARVALLFQQLTHFAFLEVLWHVDWKAQQQARV